VPPRQYHKLLWSRQLPSGVQFVLSDTTLRVYLHHQSDLFTELVASWVTLEAEASLPVETEAGVDHRGIVGAAALVVISVTASSMVQAARYGRCEAMASTTSATASYCWASPSCSTCSDGVAA
jgi:hypothetical protein